MKLLTTKTAIIAAIADINATGKKLDQMIQLAACSVIQHVGKHGDVTLLNSLVDAMPSGSRVNALRDFLGTFAKVTYSEEDKAFKYDREAKTDVAGAMAIMWTEFKPEPPYTPFDLQGMLKGLIKKAEKALGDEDHKEEVDTALLSSLKALNTIEPAH